MNEEGEGVLVKYHWEPKQGIRNLTQQEAESVQAKNFNHATQDLYEAIEKGEYPEWELCVQIMSDDEHPELDFDPLDDTKIWPAEQFPMLPVGRMVLNRNPENYFAEVEQSAFGTGVLVDGLDFSEEWPPCITVEKRTKTGVLFPFSWNSLARVNFETGSLPAVP